MAANVRLVSAGVKELLNSDKVRADLTKRAARVLAAAQSDASGYIVTGNYYNGLEIHQDSTDRAVVRVAGTAPHSHLVETKHGTLARALDAGS